MGEGSLVATRSSVRSTLGQAGVTCAAAAILVGLPLLVLSGALLAIRDLPWESTPTFDPAAVLTGGIDGFINAITGTFSWLAARTWYDFLWVAIGWFGFLVVTFGLTIWGDPPKTAEQA